MVQVRSDWDLRAHVVRHDGKDTYFPAGQYGAALGFGRRLHDGSGQPRDSEAVSGGRKTRQDFMELLTGYLTDPPYADVVGLDDHRLRVITPDGSCFIIWVERRGDGGP